MYHYLEISFYVTKASIYVNINEYYGKIEWRMRNMSVRGRINYFSTTIILFI